MTRSEKADCVKLQHCSAHAHHAGKNIWAVATSESNPGLWKIATGGADGSTMLDDVALGPRADSSNSFEEFHLQSGVGSNSAITNNKGDAFRAYAFVDSTFLLVTTNEGHVLHLNRTEDDLSNTQKGRLLGTFDDLRGYAIAVGAPRLGLAFFAGASGIIRCYERSTNTVHHLDTIEPKIAALFSDVHMEEDSLPLVNLLVTRLGRAPVYYLISKSENSDLEVRSRVVLDTMPAGVMITSFLRVPISNNEGVLIMGTRSGSLCIMRLFKPRSQSLDEAEAINVKPAKSEIDVGDDVHGREAVTSLQWLRDASNPTGRAGYLLSVGRDGKF
ncbi:hypothetical protein LTS18_014825, partial [Coniosporium uncinatum]